MRYEKYKKSISPFLEEIPFHWKETYLSHAYSLSSDTGHTEEQLLSVFLDKGVVSYSSTDQKQVHKPSEDMSKYQLVNPGDHLQQTNQCRCVIVGTVKRRHFFVSIVAIVSDL